MRECPSCKKEKNEDEFSKSTRAKECKACINKYQKSRRDKNKVLFNSKKNKQVKDRRKEIRSKVIEYLNTHPCVDCGESNHVVLQFDHLRDKEFVISEAISKGYSIERIFSEIEKCEVRCANCHIKKTAKDFNWYK